MRARCRRRESPAEATGRALRLTLLALACAVTPACSSGGSRDQADGAAGAASGDDAGPTYAPTYQAVYDEVLAPNCALPFCHGGSGAYLELGTAALGYGSLVGPGAAAQGPMCGPTGLKRVDPGRPDASLLYLKVTTPPCGAKMPLFGFDASLEPRQVDQIRLWIACGALGGDAGCPADAAVE
jgi:hypothetical protein